MQKCVMLYLIWALLASFAGAQDGKFRVRSWNPGTARGKAFVDMKLSSSTYSPGCKATTTPKAGKTSTVNS